MKKYEILEHAADIKIRVFGRDEKTLFRNALLAMQKILRPRVAEKEAKTKIRIESENLELLLFDFLSEINYLNEVNGEIYNKILFEKLSDCELEADLFGHKVKRFGRQIKGVTLHDLDVHQEEGKGWQATVLFDV